MIDTNKHQVISNDWTHLRQFTNARIALGRAGVSLPTQVNLQFQLDHARARDAVHLPLNFQLLRDDLNALGLNCEKVHSAAPDRRTYLQRPDLGRCLPDKSIERLQQRQLEQRQQLQLQQNPDRDRHIAIVIADGLSSAAVQAHAAPLLAQLAPALQSATYQLAPIIMAEQGRVALGDDIGQALAADLVIVLIGERPGLSSPDSLGIYLTFKPKRGRADSERNCISNIRPEGMPYNRAVDTCLYLVNGAFQKRLTGVQLKDESTTFQQGGNLQIPFFPSLPPLLP